MKTLFRSLLAGVSLVLFSVSAQAVLLYDFQWTGTLKITGFSLAGPALQNPDNNIFTTKFEWTLNPGSTTFVGTPNGSPTTTTGVFDVTGVGPGLLPIGIATEVGGFLSANGLTGNFAALPTVTSPPAPGTPSTLLLDDFPFNSNITFTSIMSTPTSLIYELTETPLGPPGISTLASVFNSLDGSVSPPPDGIIERPFTLSAQVTQLALPQVPAPVVFPMLLFGIMGLYLSLRKRVENPA